MKNILITLPNLSGGGAERTILNFLSCNPSPDTAFSIFIFQNIIQLKNEIPSFVKLIRPSSGYFNKTKTIINFLKMARKADLIIGGLEFSISYLAIISSILFSKKIICWVHTNVEFSPTYNKWYHKFLFKYLYRFSTRIFAVSESVKASLVNLLQGSEEKIIVLPNPIIPSKLNSISQLPEPRKNKTLNYTKILSCCRLIPEKNVRLAIKVIQRLVNENFQVELLILGDGPERTYLEEEVKQLSLEKHIRFLGFQENPFAYYAHADVFLHCSNLEGFGLVIIEAMHFGLPIVSTTGTGGPSEILKNGKFGFLLPNNDEEGIKTKISDLINEPSVYLKYRSLSKIRAKDYYPENIIPIFKNAIEKVLTSK